LQSNDDAAMYEIKGNVEEDDDDDGILDEETQLLEDEFKKIMKDINNGVPLGTKEEYSVSRNFSNYF
jgi:hypothetical protein